VLCWSLAVLTRDVRAAIPPWDPEAEHKQWTSCARIPRALVDTHRSRCNFHCARGWNYCLPTWAMNRPEAQNMWVYGNEFEGRCKDLIRRIDLSGMHVVTGGAFFGDYLPIFSEAARGVNGSADGTVFAFEPNPHSYRASQATMESNGAKATNIKLRNAAMTSVDTEIEMCIGGKDGKPLAGSSFLKNAHDNGKYYMPCGKNVTVRGVVLDKVVDWEGDIPVGMMLLDAEHHEQTVLTGALKLVKRWRPLIAVETKMKADWLEAHLKPLGYKLVPEVPCTMMLNWFVPVEAGAESDGFYHRHVKGKEIGPDGVLAPLHKAACNSPPHSQASCCQGSFC